MSLVLIPTTPVRLHRCLHLFHPFSVVGVAAHGEIPTEEVLRRERAKSRRAYVGPSLMASIRDSIVLYIRAP